MSEETQYLIDKIKMVVNRHGEFVLISTNYTVLIEYEMIGHLVEEDSHDIDELSQEQEGTNGYGMAEGLNKLMKNFDENSKVNEDESPSV